MTVSAKKQRLLAQTMVQVPNVRTDNVDDETFLISEEMGTIHHLDAMGAAIWKQLERPTTGRDIAFLLSSAFPEVDFDTIAGDVARILKKFMSSGVVVRTD